MVTYVPYCFEYDGKRYFLENLATRTGTESGDRESRRKMANRLASLRRHHYQYCTFYAIKEDIFEFFKWLRENNTHWKYVAHYLHLTLIRAMWTFGAMYTNILRCSNTAFIPVKFCGILLTSFVL